MKVKAKKLTALVLAVVCAMALGMTAFAAGSPSAGSVGSSAASATDADGNAVKVTFGSSSVAAPSGADLQKLLGDAFVEGMAVRNVMDVSVPDGTVFPVTITFNVSGVTADSHVAVLHYNGSAWEVVSSKAGNGTVTATFDSLSPVAIVTDAADSAGSAASGDASPKTGEPAVALIGVVALLAAAGVCGLKKRAF